MANLLDSDLMLVNRSGASYKATGKEVKDGFQAIGITTAALDTVSLVKDSSSSLRFTGQSYTFTASLSDLGIPRAKFCVKAVLQAKLVDTSAGTETVQLLYCTLDSDLNVTDLQLSDPGHVTVSGYTTATHTISFPAIFPNGQTPDVTLVEGCSIYVEVMACNQAYSPMMTSNVISPGAPAANTEVILSADDSADVATFNAAQDALAAYETNRRVYRRNLAASILLANFTPNEVRALGLSTDEIEQPLAVDGYYPLYLTAADANAAGNGSNHSHTFNGTTYYMPDNGPTLYHGTYSSSSNTSSSSSSSSSSSGSSSSSSSSDDSSSSSGGYGY